MIAIFYGYQAFTRGNAHWSMWGDWGPTIIPWMVLATICLMALGWYGYGRVRHGEWNWKVVRIQIMDLVNGRAPILPDQDKKGNRFQRAGKWILDEI